MCIRERNEQTERKMLSRYAVCAADSKGRSQAEEECGVRTCFQRDVDRIIHSKAFRRLKHKTQVFLSPEGDHYRTRLTHTLEVMQIARTIARAVRLNEDLTEAISMGHDLGHTPFGHAGERELCALTDGEFSHNRQSLRVVSRIENCGRGLNLTHEVQDGILHHSGETRACTLEGRIVHLADRIAYINHDIDDAVRAGLLRVQDIPEKLLNALGRTSRDRINTLVLDIIGASQDEQDIRITAGVEQAMLELRSFLYAHVYRIPIAEAEEEKVRGMIKRLFEYYHKAPSALPPEFSEIAAEDGLTSAVCDYIAGMTDRFAVSVFTNLFVPAFWNRV